MARPDPAAEVGADAADHLAQPALGAQALRFIALHGPHLLLDLVADVDAERRLKAQRVSSDAAVPRGPWNCLKLLAECRTVWRRIQCNFEWPELGLYYGIGNRDVSAVTRKTGDLKIVRLGNKRNRVRGTVQVATILRCVDASPVKARGRITRWI